MIRKSLVNWPGGEHGSVGSGVFVKVGMAVGVGAGGTTVRLEKVVGDAAGSGVAGSAVGCIPQADSNREKVKNRWMFFIARNYSLV